MIAGTGVTTLGLLLLHQLDENSSTFEMSAYFAVFGLGLGLVMQVLVLIDQVELDHALGNRFH